MSMSIASALVTWASAALRFTPLRHSRIVALPSLLVVAAAALAACSNTLDRAAIVGASATSGVGVTVRGDATSDPAGEARGAPAGAGVELPVDLEAVFEAVVIQAHGAPVFVGDGAMVIDPLGSLEAQVDAANRANPTCVLAIDALFWPATVGGTIEPSASQQAADAGTTQIDSHRRRKLAVESALATLAEFDVPIVVGDVPDRRAAVLEIFGFDDLPTDAELAEINARIAAWTAEAPERILLPMHAMVEAAASGGSIVVAGRTIEGAELRSLFQHDGLHPNAEGLVVLAQAAMEALERKALVTPDAWRRSTAEAIAALPDAAARTAAARKPGLLALISLKNQINAFNAAMADGRCDEADKLGARLFERIRRSSLDAPLGKMVVESQLRTLVVKCPESRATVAAWRDRLRPEIEVAQPRSWQLTMWRAACDAIGENQLVVDRLLPERGADGTYPEAWSAIAAEEFELLVHRSPRAAVSIYDDPSVLVRRVEGNLASALSAPREMSFMVEDEMVKVPRLPDWTAYAFAFQRLSEIHSAWRRGGDAAGADRVLQRIGVLFGPAGVAAAEADVSDPEFACGIANVRTRHFGTAAVAEAGGFDARRTSTGRLILSNERVHWVGFGVLPRLDGSMVVADNHAVVTRWAGNRLHSDQVVIGLPLFPFDTALTTLLVTGFEGDWSAQKFDQVAGRAQSAPASTFGPTIAADRAAAMAALVELVEQVATERGADVAKPIPFMLDGAISGGLALVPAGRMACPMTQATSPEPAPSIAVDLADRRVRVIGVLLPEGMAAPVPVASTSHPRIAAQVLWKDGDNEHTAMLVGFVSMRAGTLRLPAPNRSFDPDQDVAFPVTVE